MGARRKSRELALQMLFQHDMSGNTPEAIVLTFEDLHKVKPPVRDFAVRLFEGTVQHLEEIDRMIVEQADNWRITRMAVVDRNIIRMSVYEFIHEDETPKLVIIDEAIEIAKKFGTQKSGQFINGILDGILKRYNLQEAGGHSTRSGG
ncbi:MAG TPA: transcription antitermination factor NusB [Thermoanaerobaculia bacterium]|nr:transcription antitermination factor NusB [Thermoanaerobaculia bacterium]